MKLAMSLRLVTVSRFQALSIGLSLAPHCGSLFGHTSFQQDSGLRVGKVTVPILIEFHAHPKME